MSIISFKTVLDNSASFASSRMKDLCQKWKVKLIFRGAYRPSGSGIVEKITNIKRTAVRRVFTGD